MSGRFRIESGRLSIPQRRCNSCLCKFRSTQRW